MINYWSDAYILFQVKWANSYCSVRHYLTVEEKEKIFDTYIITDESDENFIKAKNDHIKEVAQEVAQEMYRDITKEKNRADDYIKSNEEYKIKYKIRKRKVPYFGGKEELRGINEIRTNYSFKENNSIYINEKNATIPHDSVESALYLKTKNASINSIILDGKKFSIEKFKEELVKNLNGQIDSFDVLNYLYVATNEYGIQRKFYYFPNKEDKTYSELGNKGIQFRNTGYTLIKSIKLKRNEGKKIQIYQAGRKIFFLFYLRKSRVKWEI